MLWPPVWSHGHRLYLPAAFFFSFIIRTALNTYEHAVQSLNGMIRESEHKDAFSFFLRSSRQCRDITFYGPQLSEDDQS